MAVEFGASIKLDSNSALQQMRKFAKASNEASRTLRKLQDETKATAQGLSGNVFRKYIDATRRVSVQTERAIAKIHDQRKAYSQLSEEEKGLISLTDRLNQKYDETARAEASLTKVRRELRMITASGLKTQKEADAIYVKHARLIKESTSAYKAHKAEIREANDMRRKEARQLRDLRMKYDKVYSVRVKERMAQMELNKLRRKGLIDGRQYTSMLAKQKKQIEHTTSSFQRMASAQSLMSKTARLVSIYSRVFLGLYAGARIATSIKDFEQMAEKIQLLSDKLEFLTGDSGAYRKLFEMTQDVGIEMQAADKIITRFAVVTNRAFSIDTMNEWSATLIKSARATGTSTQEMSGALIQITQAMSAGRLMGDEYRSVTENLPLLTVALRDMFGKSTLSLKELSSQGLITNDVMIEAFGRLKTLLEGFPDSTDTIEAAIGRLSSAWSNFAYQFSEKPIVKDVLNYVTDFVNRASRFEETQRLNESSKEHRDAVNKLRESQLRVSEQEKFIDKLFNEITIDSDEAKTRIVSNKLTMANDRLRSLNLILDEREQALRELTGNDEATAKKRAADAAIQAERELNRIYKEELKTLKLIEKIQQGKSVMTVRKNSELLRNEVNSKLELADKDEAGGIDLAEAKRLKEIIVQNEEDAIQKIYKTRVDGYLRMKGLKTKFDLEQIENEINHNNKIEEIEKQYAKRRLEIISGIEARKEGLRVGLKGEALSEFTEEKGKELLAGLDAKRTEDIRREIDSVTSSLDKLNSNAEKTIATLNKDKTGILSAEHKSIDDSFAKSVSELEQRLEKLKNTSVDTNLALIEGMDSLRRLKDAQHEGADRKFSEDFENQFSSASVALRNYSDSIADLVVAKQKLIITDHEYYRQLKLINEEYRDKVALSKSLHNELSGLDQIYAGVSRGAEVFADNTQTMYEATASLTEQFLDGSISAIVDHSENASEAFSRMIDSMLRDIQKLILKQALVSYLDIGFGSSLPSTKTLADGGITDGVSKYSGTIVRKPTVFAFAKGVGLMGEDGDEAVMPLKRGKDGKLGVSVTKEPSGSRQDKAVNKVTVRIENKGSSESKVVESKATTDVNGTIINVVLDDIRNGGPIRNSIKGMGEFR